MATPDLALLSVRNLRVGFRDERQVLPVLRDVSFDLDAGESLGIVGESGSGKTVTCLSLLRLLPSPPAVYQGGQALYRGENMWEMDDSRLREVRGGEIAFIFQEALSALNPVLNVGRQVQEALLLHTSLSGEEAMEEVVRLFEKVGIPDPRQRLDQYPHQLSGGLQQRVMIAMALACRPGIVIADEPTTALDVTIQVQILELLKELQSTEKMGLIFISHDLGVIAEICQRVLVMYAGQVVESGPVEAIFEHPHHPYTRKLIETIPSLRSSRGSFEPIAGQIPSPGNLPKGCTFHPRCPFALEICKSKEPELLRHSTARESRCWLNSDTVENE